MRYFIASITCLLLFSQCSRDTRTPEPTGSFDTLGVHWMTIDRPHITYYFQGTGMTAASIYADLHEEAYETLNKYFEAQLPQKLRYFVWTDWEQADRLLEYFQGHGGFAVPTQCVSHVHANISVGHEITHILSHWAWGTEPIAQTKFINEGLAGAFDLEANDKMEEAKAAIKDKSVPGIIDIWSGNAPVPEDILYPLSGAFMDFLHKKNDPARFNALVKNQTVEGAESIYGKEQLQALIAEFNGLVGL